MAALLASGVVPPLLALLVYAPVLRHGLLWDDSIILERQLPGFTVANAFAPPPGFYQWRYHYYRPMVTLSFMLDRALYGTDPFGYHLTVWLLHAAASYAVFLLGRRVIAPPYACLAGALFAVFPLHAEPVGWIAGRSDVLAGLFGVLASALFLRGVGLRTEPGPGTETIPRMEGRVPRGSNRPLRMNDRIESTIVNLSGSRVALAGAGALFLAALLSKESAIALAPVLLTAVWIGRSMRPARWSGWLWAGGAVIVPVFVYLAMRVLLNPGARTEAIPGGGPPALQAILSTGAFFPVHLLVPFGSPYRLAPPSGWLIILAAIGLMGLGAFVGFRSLVRRRWDLVLPLVWLAATCSVTAAAAAWNLTRTPVADRYLYMPTVGWCLLLAALASTLDSRGYSRTARATLALVAIYAFGALHRTPVYANELDFWVAAVDAEPASGAARMNLGNAFYARGEADRAMDSYRRALSLPLSTEDRSLALTDLGSVLYRQGRLEEAERTLREAVLLAPNGSTESFNLGALLYQKGIASQRRGDTLATRSALEEARVYLARAVALDALHTRALMLLGHCDLYRGDTEGARRAWKRVLEIEGPDGPVGSEAAVALSHAGL